MSEQLIKRIKIELIDGSIATLEYYETVSYKEKYSSPPSRVVHDFKWLIYGLEKLRIEDLPCIDQVDETFINEKTFLGNSYRVLEFESFS